ncbi:SDR family NAD(P)-dependent oxidoreductase [Actinomadura madurae]|uniref:SDR family NAD(P)-dependent oxidoreductase n=1 Tax=Actinomadura madurae TaxID=1993 RepID=UPI0020268EB2|nr:SDR family NAD(P)-dependent oxidoreductase [Actinomadura madurae]MCP9951205.1 SDR family oxidoreductase [Actinomadura madurae]MCP9967978.1 SDR family oxidoreductase [Actinomadura madurae]MCP9980435.1 SDR family oxidoreductase [Actinomadura madurae]URM96727.1 SDR family oxidoreductase [Actinomadura madurae]URN07412.1 SDR family oxidoreductase [Actinomadura madurae]
MAEGSSATGATAGAAAGWLGLRGARVLVLGAGGIGAECARGYLDAGADVTVVDRDPERLAALPAGPDGTRPRTRAADLTEPGAGAAAVRYAVDGMGGLDVLLHCVGVNDRRPILEFTEAEWDRVLRTNLSTAFGAAQAAGRHMVEAGGGRIVLLSSVSGHLAHKRHGPYAASKGGMNQMMRVMAAEWACHGVTVNAVAPGYVETALTADYLARPGVREDLVRLVPAGRLGTPAEVVGPVLFLSSPHAAFMTGHVMYVDGGRTLV